MRVAVRSDISGLKGRKKSVSTMADRAFRPEATVLEGREQRGLR